MKKQLVPFTPEERRVVEEDFQMWMHTLSLIARLKGAKGQFALAEDRSGFVIDVPDNDKPETPAQ